MSKTKTTLSPNQRALLAQRLKRARQRKSDPAQTIPRRPLSDAPPLSVTQERFWFLNQLEPDNPAHNRPLMLRLTGQLDSDILHQALHQMMQRHEVLRAVFPTIAGQPRQVITPEVQLALPLTDLSGLPSAEQEAKAVRMAAEESQIPFDLAQAPLLRANLFRLSESHHLLLLVMHHTLCDGWSARIFIKEIALLYDVLTKGQPSPLPALPIQYADFAHWQRQQLESGAWEAQTAYWQEKLANVPARLNLPTDRPRPAAPSYHGATHTLNLPATLVDSLANLARQENTTLFMILLAAFKVLLYRYTGQEDIVVGSPTAGRAYAELEQLVGFFVNTLVLRTNLSGKPSFRDLLQRVRQTTLEAYAHQELPFDEVLRLLKLPRDMGHAPLFQVLFNLENLAGIAAEASSLRIKEFELDSDVSLYDWNIEILQTSDGLKVALTYNTDLFDAATIIRLMGHYQTLLKGIVAVPDAPISHLSLLTEAERRQILIEWNQTQRDYSHDTCIHELFEAQAARAPDALALECGHQRLTYAQLNRRANQLAHYLQTLDVGPDIPVGLCIERSPELIVGLLGILKAGSAYLPLDPAYPQTRLDFMLTDAQTPIILPNSGITSTLNDYFIRGET